MGELQRGANSASSSSVTGMYQVKNNLRLTRQLVAHVCARPAIIVDLATRQRLSTCTRLWATAETAVKCADSNPRLIDQATKTLENTLRREGMLDLQLASFTDQTR